MSTNISLGITVSLLGAATVAGSLGTVEQRIGSINRSAERWREKRAHLVAMSRDWRANSQEAQRFAREIATVDKRLATLAAQANRLQVLGTRLNAAREDMRSRIGDIASVYGMTRMLGAPIGAFVRQDDAANALKVAMMDERGDAGEHFETVRKQAIELGNVLPGTTADFMNAARALNEQGVAVRSVIGGGLAAASHLAVVMRMPAESAAEMTAKLREAYKLTDDELPKMADAMQRAKFAFGIRPDDLMAASAYQAPILNQLGISGIENTSKMLAIQGMAAQVGLEGSSFGTNFAMMLTRLAKGPKMIEEANRGIKSHAREAVEALGIQFEFFDDRGNFAGIERMVSELEKLKTIQQQLGDAAAMEVAEALFGAEAGRPAMILAEQGVAGLREAQERMARQASLQQRIDETARSTKNTWEALTGSIENFGAALAGPAVQGLHPLINTLNDATGWLTDFAEAHPVAIRRIGYLVGGVVAASTAFLGAGVACAGFRIALLSLRMVPGLGLIERGARGLRHVLLRCCDAASALARGVGGVLARGLGIAARAVLFLGRALLMTPIGLAVTAIAGAAYLIYRYWEPIKGFFGKLWNQVSALFGRACTWITDTVTNLGNTVVSALGALPGKVMEFGSHLVDGLVGGIKAKLSAAKESIVQFGSSIKNWFASTLGIHSPSRVFLGFGQNIGEGAALGIGQMRGAVAKASGALAVAATAAFAPTVAAHGPFAAGSNAQATALPASSGAITIHFNPTINVSGGAGATVAGQVQEGLRISLREFEQLLRRVQLERSRRSF